MQGQVYKRMRGRKVFIKKYIPETKPEYISKEIALDANGQLKQGYKYIKGGLIVAVS